MRLRRRDGDYRFWVNQVQVQERKGRLMELQVGGFRVEIAMVMRCGERRGEGGGMLLRSDKGI